MHRLIASLTVSALLGCSSGPGGPEFQREWQPPEQGSDPTWIRPVFKGHGKVVRLPDATDQPREGSKVALDVTSIKGLEKVPRVVNIYAAHGVTPDRVTLVAVLHGDATPAALTDEAYRHHMGKKANPHAALLSKLKEVGVTVIVCGQALAQHEFTPEQVREDVEVSVSAVTSLVNRQADGWALVPL